MEKSKAYKEGIQIPYKKVLVKNPKIYGIIAAALFAAGIVMMFLNIFNCSVSRTNAATKEVTVLWGDVFNLFQSGHWFVYLGCILAVILGLTGLYFTILAVAKDGKGMKIAIIAGYSIPVLLILMLLFMNTTLVTIKDAAGKETQTTIAKYYAIKPLLEVEGNEYTAFWNSAQNGFTTFGWLAVGLPALAGLVASIYVLPIPKVTKLNAVRTLQSYGMILLSLAGLSIFVVYPLVWIVRYSVFEYKGWGTMNFVGFDQFINIFTKETSVKYWISVKNTFVFAIGKLIVEIPLALILAFILTRKLRGATFFRAMYFMPSMVSVAVIGVIFTYLFKHVGGVVNTALNSIGAKEVMWFSNGWSAMLVVMIASIWQNFGLNMLFFMTGLQSISPEMYEAAMIDGASNTRQFFSITIPLLGPVLQMVLMNAILGSLKVTDLVMTLTQGRPDGKTQMMMTYIYYKFFGDSTAGVTAGNWGYAAACTVMTAIILALVTIIYLRATKKSADVY